MATPYGLHVLDIIFFDIRIDWPCSLHRSIILPSSFLPSSFSIKMADDLFDGAIGIDLGTTYS